MAVKRIWKTCTKCGCAKFHIPSGTCSQCGHGKTDAGPQGVCWEYQAGELPIRLSFTVKVF